jgi:predicted dehydrogenase
MNDRRKIRYAVVGAGNIAQVAILPAFAHARENSELVAILSDDPEKRAALGKRYGVKHTGTYDELEQVLAESRADAVYITTPNSVHRRDTERAARAGVHVLCEKPLAATVEDCEAMIRVCKENRVKLMTAYRLHFEPGNLEAIQLVQSGELGKVKMFSSVFSHQVKGGDVRTRGELGGGAMLDLGVYPVNAARSLFRDEPREVLAMMPASTDPRFQEVDETITAVLRFPRGEVAQLTVSQGAASVSEYRVVGTEATLRLEPAFEYVDDIKLFVTRAERTREKTFKRGDQFAPQLIHFSSSILSDSQPEPSGEEGLADVRVVSAVLESARTGRAITLPPFTRVRHPDPRQAMHKPPVGNIETVNAPSPSK